MIPNYSIGLCPICGTGLCGIRVCGVLSDQPHGLIVCDQCEAIWQQPDLGTSHTYPQLTDARCPECQAPLWGEDSRWASLEECMFLRWEHAIDSSLNRRCDQEPA